MKCDSFITYKNNDCTFYANKRNLKITTRKEAEEKFGVKIID